MTQHQKTQGYYPSLGSMFADLANRQHGSSLLLNSTDARGAGSTSAWASNPPNQQPLGQIPNPHPHPLPHHPQHPHPQHPHPQHPHPHAHQQHGQQQPNPSATYMRPPPPLPTTSSTNNETFAQSQLQTESNRIIQASDSTKPLKSVSLPRECLPRFLAIAKVNTEMNKETCGLLLGKDKGHRYSVTTLLIPKQTSTSDTCTMLEEELVLQFTEERSLITLGWVSFLFFSSVTIYKLSSFFFVDTYASFTIM
jgi:STAM-binding protein